MTSSGSNLHIYPAPIVSESRIFRQTLAVEQAALFDRIEICGTPAPGLPETEPLSDSRIIRRIGTAAKDGGSVIARIRFQFAWSGRVYRTYSSSDVRVVNAHSVAVLPVAALLARRLGARLIYDTHELETETSTSKGLQGRLFRLVERALIRKADAVFVVNDLIREWYEKTYPGLSTISIVNAPDRSSSGAVHDLRDAFAIPSDERLYVHVGNLVGSRHIPDLVDVFAARPGDHLVFLGDGDLADVVREAAERHSNIHHHSSVESESVVPTLATADVGICLIEPTCLSYELSLPNKAIEYTAAGVPFIHNALPAVRRLLDDHLDTFVVRRVPEDLETVIAGLSEDVVTRAKSDIRRVRLPSWKVESTKMLDAYRRLLAHSSRGSGRS